MSKDSKTWIVANLAVVIAYTINFIPYLIKIPVSINKHIIISFLIVSYASTYNIQDTFGNLPGLLLKSNTYCLLLFMTFPAKILLLPFYFIAVINLSAFVIKNRKQFENYRIYEISKKIMLRKREAYLLCYFTEISMIPMCILLMCFGACTLLTFMAYLYVVLFEYKTNSIMREAFYYLRIYCDKYSACLGEGRTYYYNFRNWLIRNFAEDTKKIN